MTIENKLRAHIKDLSKAANKRNKPTQHTPGPPEPSVYSHELAAVIEQRDELLAACKYAEQYLTGAGAFAAYQKIVAAIAKAEGRAQ